MTKVFYDHLVLMEEVIAVIDAHGLSPGERQKLISAIDQLFHHQILDTILTHLPQKHHQTFLKLYTSAPHDPALLFFLKQNATVDIEKAIKIKAQEVKQEVFTEIKKAKKG